MPVETSPPTVKTAVAKPGRIRRFLDSDIGWSFRTTPAAWISALVLVLLVVTAFLAPLIAAQNPYDLSQIFIDKAEIPPIWQEGGEWPFLLGTDPQGRDVLSAIMYGMRISLAVGISAIVLAIVVGIAIGLISGYTGGAVDTVLMRVADVQLTFPSILTALLVDGVITVALPRTMRESLQVYVMIFAIGISLWPSFARTVSLIWR